LASSKITGLGTAAALNTGTASGNIPLLDGTGKLSTAILPSIAINDTFAVATESAMLALTAQRGDIAIRSDLNKSYVLAVDAPETLANWKELLTPTDTVLSVAGRTGAIALTVTDVSGAAPLASPALTGTPTAPTASVAVSTTQLATTSFVHGAIALDRPYESTLTNIKVNGAQAVGTVNTVARGDHVHPTDTTRASLNSPVFTGTPTAPTVASPVNATDQIATTAFVKAVLEYARAYEDDPSEIKMNGVAHQGSSILVPRANHVHPTDTTRAPLASPVFTGTPAAPTATAGTATTQLATTAFVLSQGFLTAATIGNIDGGTF